MSVILVGELKVKNPQKLAEYRDQAGPLIRRYGGEPVAKGKSVRVIAGHNDFDSVVIFRFPSLEQAMTWYQSPEYQALIPIRDEAADLRFTAFEE